MARIDELFVQVIKLEKRINVTHIHEKIALLNVEDQDHPIGSVKIQSELQSYDLLQNEKYNRLEELKRVR